MTAPVERSVLAQPCSIGDYALIGDCRSAALISRHGSVDWLCWPHFGSSSLFAALLDELSGGRFIVCPRANSRVERRYLDDTAVLETRHVTDGGELVVTDCMPVLSEAAKKHRLTAEHELLRLVRCTRGEVELKITFQPRFDYGRTLRALRRRGPGQIACQRAGSLLLLVSSLPLEVTDSIAEATCVMRAGETHALSLTYTDGEPATLLGLGEHAEQRLDETIRWWRTWTARCAYEGEYRDALMRSLLTLKLLTFAPSGAVVAAPTTSIPECPGGERNWDYRYCWIRDASLVVSGLLDLGYADEAAAYIAWLLHTTRRTAPRLRTMYDVFGHPRLVERQIPWLAGFLDSRPVRVGNAAHGQLQLDCYGEVVAAVADFVERGGTLESASRRMLVGFGEEVCRSWRQPDEGIWELRSGRRHNTHSKVLCWAALDRLTRLHRKRKLEVPLADFEREKAALAEAIETRAYDPERRVYSARFGGTECDAALLLMGHYGFLEPASARAVDNRWRIEQELARGPLVARYAHGDGLSGGEGAFGACCFWLVTALAEQGEYEHAHRNLATLLAYANDVGLFAEEFAWDDGSPLGNFPQAFTHAGALHAVLTLSRCEQQARLGARASQGERV